MGIAVANSGDKSEIWDGSAYWAAMTLPIVVSVVFAFYYSMDDAKTGNLQTLAEFTSLEFVTGIFLIKWIPLACLFASTTSLAHMPLFRLGLLFQRRLGPLNIWDTAIVTMISYGAILAVFKSAFTWLQIEFWFAPSDPLPVFLVGGASGLIYAFIRKLVH